MQATKIIETTRTTPASRTNHTQPASRMDTGTRRRTRHIHTMVDRSAADNWARRAMSANGFGDV